MESKRGNPLLSFQKFVVERHHRSEFKNAPYNPRTLSPRAKDKLKASLKEDGLVEPLIWNRRTGHLVGGHQRISILDSLERSSDYSMDVSVIDVDEASEKRINVRLNNTLAMGDWDLTQLESIGKEVGFESLGFDNSDLMQLLGKLPSSPMDSATGKLSEKLKAAQELYASIKEKLAKDGEEFPLDFYLVVVFKAYEDRKLFADKCGVEDNRYVDGMKLLESLNAAIGTSTENKPSLPLTGITSLNPETTSSSQANAPG